MPGGRPSKFTKELAAVICERLRLGESLRQICRDDGIPDLATVIRWLGNEAEEFKEFRAHYAQAKSDQMDHFAEEIIEISDDGSNDWTERETKAGRMIKTENHEVVNRSRLRVDTRKWVMSKLAPKKYGEKITQEITGKDGGPIAVIKESE